MELKDISGKFNNMLNSKFESFYDEISSYMLEEFKQILESLQKGDIDNVNSSLAKISQGADVKIVESEIFQEIGKLTRELHNDITGFVSEVQPELEMLSDGEVSQATTRLESVIKLTEASANSTLDLSEELMNENNKQFKMIQALKRDFLPLMGDDIKRSEARKILANIEAGTQTSNMKLMEIMTAQEFQDRVGQTLKKVIALVENVEGRLVHFVEKFGGMFKNNEAKPSKDIVKPSEEKIKDAFSDNLETVGQDDVNDLLAEFGF